MTRLRTEFMPLPIFAVTIGLIIGTTGAKAVGPTPEEYVARVGGDAKIVPAGMLTIDGRKIICGTRPTVLDNNLDDYAAAYPGFIILNPKLMAEVSTPVKFWIYSQSCGYQLRGPDRKIADCFAVERGLRHGWLTPAALDAICAFIAPARGDNVHPAGAERCNLMRKCFKDAGTTGPYPAQRP